MGNDKRPLTPLDWALSTLPILTSHPSLVPSPPFPIAPEG